MNYKRTKNIEHVELILPSHKYVTWFLASEDIIILQNDLVCVPDDHPQFKPGHDQKYKKYDETPVNNYNKRKHLFKEKALLRLFGFYQQFGKNVYTVYKKLTDLTREHTSLVSLVKCRGRGQVQSYP